MTARRQSPSSETRIGVVPRLRCSMNGPSSPPCSIDSIDTSSAWASRQIVVSVGLVSLRSIWEMIDLATPDRCDRSASDSPSPLRNRSTACPRWPDSKAAPASRTFALSLPSTPIARFPCRATYRRVRSEYRTGRSQATTSREAPAGGLNAILRFVSRRCRRKSAGPAGRYMSGRKSRTPPALGRRRPISHLRGQVARHFHTHADLANFWRRPCHNVVPSLVLRARGSVFEPGAGARVSQRGKERQIDAHAAREGSAKKSKGPRERAAVDKDVLAGDESGVSAGQEGAERAEFGRIAEAAGGDSGLRVGARLIHAHAPLRGGAREAGFLAVGFERPGLDRVDCHVVAREQPGRRGEEGGEPRPRPRRHVETGDRRPDGTRGDVDDAAELACRHAGRQRLNQRDRSEHVGLDPLEDILAANLAESLVR